MEIQLSHAEKTIHQRALWAAATFCSAQSELLKVIIEVDKSRLFEKFGRRSSFAYCISELGLSEDMAVSFIQVGRKCEEVPQLKLAVEEGLSISKARKILPVLNSDNQEKWIENARELPYRALETEIARENPVAVVPEKAKPISSTHIKLQLCIENPYMEMIRRAHDLLATKMGRSVSLEETFAAMAREYVVRHDPVKKAVRARKPAKSGHLVNARDKQKCQAEGCDQPRWLHIHHVKPRSEGGTDEAKNLTTLCSFHHRQIHRIHPSGDG